MDDKKEQQRDSQLEEIAKGCLKMKDLKTRMHDGSDFYDLPVWDIKQALQLAYTAGRDSKSKTDWRQELAWFRKNLNPPSPCPDLELCDDYSCRKKQEIISVFEYVDALLANED
jgi:hypothetical protein